MKKLRVMTCLLAALALFCLTGCGGQETLVGTWETSVEMSVLGEGVEPGRTETGVLHFVFLEDGTGSMDVMDAELVAKLPETSRPFQYSTNGDQLTLDNDGGMDEVYTFTLEGDTLTLENHRISLELTRVS